MSDPDREGARAVRDISVTVGPRRRWSTIGGTRATGYAFRGQTLLRADQLARAVEDTQVDGLESVLDGLTGSFAAIKESPGGAHAIVDDIRGIPLYCVEDGDRQVVTDDPLHTAPDGCARLSDWRCRAELLKSSCVTGSDTLLADVRQVEAGTVLDIPRDPVEPIAARQYCAFRPNLDPDPPKNLVEVAYETHRAAVNRMIEFADGSLIAVPLSAGLDSGILVALLATSGIERDQILTFTYGRLGNRESEVSRGVAESLGLRWEFVPYSERTWVDLAAESWWTAHLTWASALAGVPAFKDVPALVELRRRGTVPEGSVVVPGHTLGFISGSFIPGSLLRRRRGSRSDVVDAVLAAYYKYRSDDVIGKLLDRSPAEVAEALRERADRALPATPSSMPRAQLVSLTEEFGWKERQAKLIANGVRTYEQQDLRWALPWWDREVFDFWARVPLRQRVGQRLRRDLAKQVGWPDASRSFVDRLQDGIDRQVRVFALDDVAKKVRNVARRSTRKNRYHGDELASFALFGEERFLSSYHGTETPRALLAEDVLAALDARAVPER